MVRQTESVYYLFFWFEQSFWRLLGNGGFQGVTSRNRDAEVAE